MEPRGEAVRQAPITLSLFQVREGKWHHVALVYNGARMKFYVDKRFRNRKALSGTVHVSAGGATYQT